MTRQGSAIRVLLVDDSKPARDLMRAVLESERGIVVVGEAANGAEAVAKVAAFKPDLVTMDIEMPVMGGLEAIGKIIAEQPVPILAVTAQADVRTAFAAISAGALDVIERPDISLEHAQALIAKILYLSKVDVCAHQQVLENRGKTVGSRGGATQKGSPQPRLVAIAASTGGPHAIHAILARLSAAFPLPIVIAQHIAEGFTQGMAEWLNAATPLAVAVAESGARLAPGCVYVNPAEHAMQVTEQGLILLGDREAGQRYRPCCDTLLSSVAAAYGKDAIGLIMSGMGNDGVAGMQAIGKAGGVTLAQDATSSVVYGMNRLAVESGCIQKVVALSDIPAELTRLAGGKR